MRILKTQILILTNLPGNLTADIFKQCRSDPETNDKGKHGDDKRNGTNLFGLGVRGFVILNSPDEIKRRKKNTGGIQANLKPESGV